MAQRSPTNPRYQKDAKIGSTRKSAASAKPKRSVGERGPSEKKPAQKKKRSGMTVEPISTPEIKALRKRWWVFMGIALASAAVLLVPAVQGNSMVTSLAVGAWAASFVTALYIDWVQIRKLRKAEIERRKKEEKR